MAVVWNMKITRKWLILYHYCFITWFHCIYSKQFRKSISSSPRWHFLLSYVTGALLCSKKRKTATLNYLIWMEWNRQDRNSRKMMISAYNKTTEWSSCSRHKTLPECWSNGNDGSASHHQQCAPCLLRYLELCVFCVWFFIFTLLTSVTYFQHKNSQP